MLGLKPKPRTETRAPPAKRWRNYYRVYRVLTLGRLGPLFPGIHGGPDVFPSKEVAEEHARIFLGMINYGTRPVMDFAGAYPEGERAN
jgi:hypothetical protein